ncbi:hypothetical protein CLU80_0272 [Pseudomonas sp. 29]|uniref:hypothetical protein n=1 Tax=Pseudomonas sp. 29 TaxID=2035197 RepID=UPI000C189CB7|nr:hypothetical protein [Pseudomonas sp. 29]PIF48043.1 hypothetical protein CLU80_0272 [Pseudomonas sp. 29]
MFHNALYRLERNQKTTLLWLGLTFLALSVLWFFTELLCFKFPMEPIVVFVGGSATLFASYWPWKPSYASERLRDRISFDYQNSNDHEFVIGRGNMRFTLRFSKADGESIYIYRDPPDIEKIAMVFGAGNFSEVRDVSALDYASRELIPAEGQIVSLMNSHGCYALVHIHDIKDAKRSDHCDEVTFSYVINPVGKLDFS